MFNDEFYPTPEPLARKLAEDFKLWEINTILEPSAGKGDLMHGFLKQFGSRDADRVSVFCCEIEPELCEILKSKRCRVIGSDFLQFSEKMTQDLKSRFLARVNDLIFYEFNEENIKKMYIEMNKQITGGIEEAIIKLFDHFSIKSYWDENSSNIHYFNGWKTNKAYIVNKKVIQRLCGTSYFGERWEVRYETQEVLEDMEKVFDYLNPVKEEHETIRQTVSRYEREKKSTQIIEFYYFKCQFYKKGTCHITFKNEDLLKKFNLYGCIHHKWLFDSYGKKPYKDMSAEEKMVVDEFEGKKAYAETCRKADYYLTDDFGELKMIGIN